MSEPAVHGDGISPGRKEKRTPKTEMVGHDITAPLEAHVIGLAGLFRKESFRIDGGGKIELTAVDTPSLFGIRRNGSKIPMTFDIRTRTLAPSEIHPTDPTKRIIRFEEMFIHTDRRGSKVQVGKGHYDVTTDSHGETVWTPVVEEIPQDGRAAAREKMSALIMQLTAADKITKFGRTDAEAAIDYQLANDIHNKIDELLELAKKVEKLTIDPNDGTKNVRLAEDGDGRANLELFRTRTHDIVAILDRDNVTYDHAPGGVSEFPYTYYHIPLDDRRRQTVSISRNVSRTNAAGQYITLPPDMEEAMNAQRSRIATHEEVREMFGRIKDLEQRNLWIND